MAVEELGSLEAAEGIEPGDPGSSTSLPRRPTRRSRKVIGTLEISDEVHECHRRQVYRDG